MMVALGCGRACATAVRRNTTGAGALVIDVLLTRLYVMVTTPPAMMVRGSYPTAWTWVYVGCASTGVVAGWRWRYVVRVGRSDLHVTTCLTTQNVAGTLVYRGKHERKRM